MALIVTGPGQFIPDLGLWVSGPTSAFKRAVVISVEDSFDGRVPFASFLAAGLLSQRAPSWNPPAGLVRSLLLSCFHVANSRAILFWVERRR